MRGLTFMQVLIDDYIVPMLGSGGTDFSGLAAALVKLACMFLMGIACSYGYGRSAACFCTDG